MEFLLGLIGACAGIIIAFVIIVAIIYRKAQNFIGKENMKELVEVAKEAKDIEKQEYSRQKSIGGITNLIEPEIIRDFGDFNKDFLFSKVEKNLRTIFSALEDKTTEAVRNDNDLIYMRSVVEDKINDMRGSGRTVRYDDVKFHNHAIKSYKKSKGRATIAVSSTVEYYYDTNEKKFNPQYKNIKKNTRYTTEYVYVYDESAFDYNATNFTVTCPNCGAGIEFFGAGNCKYCGTYIEPINLKNWFMVSYKEDY